MCPSRVPPIITIQIFSSGLPVPSGDQLALSALVLYETSRLIQLLHDGEQSISQSATESSCLNIGAAQV